MKTINAFFFVAMGIGLISCSNNGPLPGPSSQSFPVADGGFELWDSNLPVAWQTNSCPPCLPQFEMYIVRQDTDAYQGQYAAKFIYNNVFAATAEQGFAITRHPQQLKAFLKCNVVANDSVHIAVRLFNNNVVVDGGEWYGATSIASYTQVQIPITQNAMQVDSVAIFIEGGHVNAYPQNNTELWVDAVTLE